MEECRTKIVCCPYLLVNEKCNLISQVWQNLALSIVQYFIPVVPLPKPAKSQRWWEIQHSNPLLHRTVGINAVLFSVSWPLPPRFSRQLRLWPL